MAFVAAVHMDLKVLAAHIDRKWNISSILTKSKGDVDYYCLHIWT